MNNSFLSTVNVTNLVPRAILKEQTSFSPSSYSGKMRWGRRCHCDKSMQKRFIQKCFNEIVNQFDGKRILS